MVIWHICSIYKPSNGIFFVLKNLSEVQKRLGNKVLIFNVDKRGVHNDEDIIIFEEAVFKNLINETPPDIVIFHGVFYKQIITVSHLLRRRHIPYLIELHGALSKQNMLTSTMKKKLFNTLFLNNIIKKSQGIIYLNRQELNNSTVSNLHTNNIIIPNGCEQHPYISNHQNGERLNLLFIGRIFRQHKGLDLLLPAVKNAVSKGVNLHFFLCGRGDKQEMEWLFNEIKGFEDKIEYRGEVFGKEKEDILKSSDVFILTSRYEGFPIAILEAMSFGLICIVTPETNVADIIQENKCGIVTKFDVDDIENAIIKISHYSNSEIVEMGKRGKRTALNYSWDQIGELSLKKYKEVINSI